MNKLPPKRSCVLLFRWCESISGLSGSLSLNLPLFVPGFILKVGLARVLSQEHVDASCLLTGAVGKGW